ncbi:MAG TPA: hypothetical protein VJ654_20390 [Noviherbaspirillum sp.]|nr:hypothetical protein [Noviherbaspirillum sp.]
MNTLQKSERILTDAKASLLDLAQEIGAGKRVGMDSETAMRIFAISEEIGKAIPLLFASDGTEGPATPSIELH